MNEEETTSPAFADATGSGETVETQETPSVEQATLGSSMTTETAPVPITRDMLLSAIPEEIRNEAIFQNINGENPIADLAGQFLNAQRLVGVEKMPAPKESWEQDQWDQFYNRIGRPETPDKYVIPESEGVALNPEALNEFKALAHQSGLTTKQFERVVDFHNKYYGSSQQKMEQEGQAQLQQGLAALQQEWGDSYQENLDQTSRFFQNEIKDQGLRDLILNNAQLRNSPAIIKHFHQLSRDAREAAVRVGDSTNPSVISTTEQAQAALKKYEEENRDMLFTRRDSLSLQERSRLDEVIQRRSKLYQLAFPE